jgi:hypothetical protein
MMSCIPEGEHLTLSSVCACSCCGAPTMIMTIEDASNAPLVDMKLSIEDALGLIAGLIARFDINPEQIIDAVAESPDNKEALRAAVVH